MKEKDESTTLRWNSDVMCADRVIVSEDIIRSDEAIRSLVRDMTTKNWATNFLRYHNPSKIP